MEISKAEMVKESKYALIIYLVEEKKLSILEIIKLDPVMAMLLLDASTPDIIAECLREYLNKNLTAIKKSNLFFPGREGGESSQNALIIGLRAFLKKQGKTLKDIGLPGRAVKEKPISDSATPKEILEEAKNLLSK